MKANIVQFRYEMPRVLKALRMREPVTLLYRGQVQGTLMPARSAARKSVRDSAFFGMRRGDKRSVPAVMNDLRAPRHRGL